MSIPPDRTHWEQGTFDRFLAPLRRLYATLVLLAKTDDMFEAAARRSRDRRDPTG